MGRYLTQTTDKAEQLEEWVQKLAEETNKSLDGSELYNVNLIMREPHKIGEQEDINGFVSMYIKFSSKEPDFLTRDDKESWYSRIRELAGSRFGIDQMLGLEYASIDFEEQSEEELYILTHNKESTIRSGFDRIKKYAEWYCSAVENYSNVVQAHTERMKQYLRDLETLSEEPIS